jgi:hypothetical protein
MRVIGFTLVKKGKVSLALTGSLQAGFTGAISLDVDA